MADLEESQYSTLLIIGLSLSLGAGGILAWYSKAARTPTESERNVITTLLSQKEDASAVANSEGKQAGSQKVKSVKKDKLGSSKKKKKAKTSSISKAVSKIGSNAVDSAAPSHIDDGYEPALEDDSIEDLLLLSSLAKPKAAALAKSPIHVAPQPIKKRKMIPEAVLPLLEEVAHGVQNPGSDAVSAASDAYQEIMAPAADVYSSPDVQGSDDTTVERASVSSIPEHPAREATPERELLESAPEVSAPADSPNAKVADVSASSDLARELERAQGELRTIEQHLAQQGEAHATLQSQNEELVSASTRLAEEIEQARRASQLAKKLQQDNLILKDTNRILTQSLSAAQLNAKEADDRSHKALQTAAAGEEALANLRSVENTRRELQSQLASLIQEDAASRREAADTKRRSAQLEEALQRLEQDLSDERERANEHHQVALNTRDTVSEYESRLTEARREQRDRAARIQELELFVQNLQRELTATKADREVADGLRRDLDEFKRRDETERKQMIDELQRERNTVAKLRSTLEQSSKDHESTSTLRRQLGDAEAQKKAAEIQTKEIARDLEAKVKETEQLVLELQNVRKTVTANEFAGAKVKAHEKSIAALQKELIETLRKNELSEAELQKSVTALQAVHDAALEKIRSLESTISAYQAKQESLQAERDAHFAAAEIATRDVQSATLNAESLRADLERARSASQETDALRAEIDRLKADGVAAAERSSASETELTETRNLLQTAQKLATEKAHEITILEGDKAALAARIEDATRQIEAQNETRSPAPTATTPNVTAKDSGAAPQGPTTKSHEFVWKHGGNDVIVTGSFDNWTERIRMTRVEGTPTHFSAKVALPLDHEETLFKYLVDGAWRTDADAQVVWRDGVENNVVRVADL
ncbi:hypothetical protein HKX48_005439 [Thoreauomyces humboldtii]|nr:hypothetical protein HKX48_005439 [Thoreauomyces humboldtii]